MRNWLVTIINWFCAIPGILKEYGAEIKNRAELIIIAGLMGATVPPGVAVWFTRYQPTEPRVWVASLGAFLLGAVIMSMPSSKEKTTINTLWTGDTLWTAIFMGLFTGVISALIMVFVS